MQRRFSRGPPGPAGKDAFDLHFWTPKALSKLFRENEECTYYFDSAADGLITRGDKVIRLKDRFGDKKAICLKKIQKPVKELEIFVLPLKGDLYKIEGI